MIFLVDFAIQENSSTSEGSSSFSSLNEGKSFKERSIVDSGCFTWF
ncbi:MAG: hypothetical protein R2877_02840 [Bdellovibrionota bacterium]